MLLKLVAESDLTVREAVAAHIAGRPLHRMRGDVAFETRNNLYRLVDGVVFEARHPTMLGAEFVGWLFESPGDAVMQAAWHVGGRGVFVHRSADRLIIVTSNTQRFARAGAILNRGSMDPHGSAAALLPTPLVGARLPYVTAPRKVPPPLPPRFPGASAFAGRVASPIPPIRLPPPPLRRAPDLRPQRTTPPAGTSSAPEVFPPASRSPLARSATPVHAPPRLMARPTLPPAGPLPPHAPAGRPIPLTIPGPPLMPTMIVPPYPMAPRRIPEPATSSAAN